MNERKTRIHSNIQHTYATYRYTLLTANETDAQLTKSYVQRTCGDNVHIMNENIHK